MNLDIRPPLITGTTVAEQVQQIIRYLIKLVRQLQQMSESAPDQVVSTKQGEQSRCNYHKLQVNKELQVAGKLLVAGGINGAYVQAVRVWGFNNFALHCGFNSWGPGRRQSFLVSGSMNGTPVLGVIRVSTGGGVVWSGTEGVTVTTETGGIIRVTMNTIVYDEFLIQSPLEFTV